MSLEGGWRYVSRSGRVQGPIALDELRRLLSDGTVDNESQVHHRMMGWRWLGHVVFGSSYTHPLGRSHRATGIPAAGPSQGGPLWGSITTASTVRTSADDELQDNFQSEKKKQPLSLARQPSLSQQESGSPRISVGTGPSTKLTKGVMRQTVPAVRSSLQPAPMTTAALPKAAASRPPTAQVVSPAQAGECVAGTSNAYASGNTASQSWTASGDNRAGGTVGIFLDASVGPPLDQTYLIVRDDEPEPKTGPRPFANPDKIVDFEDDEDDIGQEDILLGPRAVLQPSAKRQRREAAGREANATSGRPQPEQKVQHPRKPQLPKSIIEPQRPSETHEMLQVTKPKKPPLQQLQPQVGQERPLKHPTQQVLQLQTQRSASLDDRPSKDQQSCQQKPLPKAAPAIASLPAAATTAQAAPARGTLHVTSPASRGQADRDNPDELRQAKRRKLADGPEGKKPSGPTGKGVDNDGSLPRSRQQPMHRVIDDKRGSDISAAGSGAVQAVASGSTAVMTGFTVMGNAAAARDVAGVEGSAQVDEVRRTVNSSAVSKPTTVPTIKSLRPPATAAAQAPSNTEKRPDGSTLAPGSAALGPEQSSAEPSQAAVIDAPMADQAAGGVRNGMVAAATGPSAAGISARLARQGLCLPNIADLVKLKDRRPASLLSLVTGAAPAMPRPAATGKPSLMDTVSNLNEKRRQNLPREVFLALEEVWQYRVGSFVSDDVCALELQDRVNRGELEPSTMATHSIEGFGCAVKKILEDNARAVTVVTCIRDNKPCPAAPLVVDVSLYEQLPEVMSAPARPREKPPGLLHKSASAPGPPVGGNVSAARSDGNGSERVASKHGRQPPPQPPPPAPPRRRSLMSVDPGSEKSGAPPVGNSTFMRTPLPPPYRQPNTGYAPLSQVRRRPYRGPDLPQMPSNGYPHDGGFELHAAAASVHEETWGGLQGVSASADMAWGGDYAGGAPWGEDDGGGEYGGGGRSPSPEDVSEPAPSGVERRDVAPSRATAQAAPASVPNLPLHQCAMPAQPPAQPHSREPPQQLPVQPGPASLVQPPQGQPQPLPRPPQEQPRSGWPQSEVSGLGLQAVHSSGDIIPIHPYDGQRPRPYVPGAPSPRTQPQPAVPTQPPAWQPQQPYQHAPSVSSSDPSPRFHTGGPRTSAHQGQQKPSLHPDRHSYDVGEPGGRGPARGGPSLPSVQGKIPVLGVLLPMHDGLPPGLGSEEPPKAPTAAVAEPAIASAENLTPLQNIALPPHLRKQALQGQQQRPEQQVQVAQSQPMQPQTQRPLQSQHAGQQKPKQAQSQPQNLSHASQIQLHPSVHRTQTQTQQQVANEGTVPVQQIPGRQSGSQAPAAATSMSLGAAHASAEIHTARTSTKLQKGESQQGLAPTTALCPGLGSEASITTPGAHALSALDPAVGPKQPPDQAAATRAPPLAAAATAAGPTAGRGMPPPAAMSAPAQASMGATNAGADVASLTSAGGTAVSPVALAVTQVDSHTLNVTLNLNNKTEMMERLEMMLKMLRSEAGQSDTAPATNPRLETCGNTGGGLAVTAQVSEPISQAQSLADTATKGTLAQATPDPLLPQPSQLMGAAMPEVAVAGAAVQAALDVPQPGLQQSAIDLTSPVIKPEPGVCEGPVGPQMPGKGQTAWIVKGEEGCVTKGVVGRASALTTTILKFKIYPLHLFFCQPYIPEPMIEDWSLHPVRPEFIEVEDDDVDAVLTLEDQDVPDSCAVADEEVDKLATVPGTTTAVNEAAVDLLYKLLRGD